MSRQRERMPNEMLICLHILPVLLLCYCQGKIGRLQKCSGWRAKRDWGWVRKRTINLTESLLDVEIDADSDLLLLCTDNKGVKDLLLSCLKFVNCVRENSFRVLVQANRSCCIAPWIQLRVGGAQMAVFMCFLCWLACCWVWCGLQRGEVKHTNTFLFKILLWSGHF